MSKKEDHFETVKISYDSVISYMNSEDESHLVREFLGWHKKIDSIRGENLFETFPELREIL
jgi:hypothetical protein